MIALSQEDAYRQIATASLVVRDRAPIDVSLPCIVAAFGLLDWGMREAPTTGLREMARKALAKAVLPRPTLQPGTLPPKLFARPDATVYVPAFLAPEPPRPGAA